MSRMTKEQIDDLESGLNQLLPWCITYASHLACFERVCALGYRAVRDLRERRLNATEREILREENGLPPIDSPDAPNLLSDGETM